MEEKQREKFSCRARLPEPSLQSDQNMDADACPQCISPDDVNNPRDTPSLSLCPSSPLLPLLLPSPSSVPPQALWSGARPPANTPMRRRGTKQAVDGILAVDRLGRVPAVALQTLSPTHFGRPLYSREKAGRRSGTRQGGSSSIGGSIGGPGRNKTRKKGDFAKVRGCV